MKKPILLSLFASIVFACFAKEDSTQLKIYFVARIAESVLPRNMMDDAIWKNIGHSSVFVPNEPTRIPQDMPGTDFQAAYNSKYLFVRINADEPSVEKVDFTAPVADRDDYGGLSKSCKVQFFLDPILDGKSVAQIITSINGGVYDAITSGNVGWVYEGLVFRTVSGKKGWIMTVAFPWKDGGVDNVFAMSPNLHPVMGFNACRDRVVGSGGSTQWSKTPAHSYPRPEYFGFLVLSEEKNAIPKLQQCLADVSGGIDLNGAVENAREIYKKAIENAILAGLQNARMVPQPRGSQIFAEFKKMQEEMREDSSLVTLAKILKCCGALNTEIKKHQNQMSGSILDGI